MYNTQNGIDDQELKCRPKHHCMVIHRMVYGGLYHIMRQIYEEKVMLESWHIIRDQFSN